MVTLKLMDFGVMLIFMEERESVLESPVEREKRAFFVLAFVYDWSGLRRCERERRRRSRRGASARSVRGVTRETPRVASLTRARGECERERGE